ncbi:Flavohemoprotein [Orbilia brochopaga]|nr:Flavohemoprotein [Drechslerella brochopaga]
MATMIPDVAPPTPEQIAIVKSTAAVLEVHGVTITTAFYANMHREIPILHEVFNQANQRNGHQARALAMSVLAYAKNIDNLAVLSEAVETICQKHASILIEPAQYEIVGKYLLEAIKQVLGDAATDEIISAWAAAYWMLARILINREEQIYREHSSRDWRPFVVSRKVKESEEITSFYLKPTDGNPVEHYKPGQYISIRIAVPQQEWKQSRQYSLSDSPDYAHYRISVKRMDGIDTKDPAAVSHPGWVSNVLHDTVKEGDTVDLTFPCGSFFLDTKESAEAPVVLVSGGVGLTPLMSMLNTLIGEGSDRSVTWIHTTRSRKAYAFEEQVETVMKTKPYWRAVVYSCDPALTSDGSIPNYRTVNSRLDLRDLDSSTDLHLDNPETQYFICGPEKFMAEMTDRLVSLGALANKVKYEKFGTGNIEGEEKPAPILDHRMATCPVSGVQGKTLECPSASFRQSAQA